MPTIERITKNAQDAATLTRWSGASAGLVLVSGLPGSGKTTTVYACLSQIAASTSAKIYVTGDTGVDALQVHQISLGANGAIPSDLDVLFVDEEELWSSALDVAKSGHVVFVQIEAASAAQARDAFIEATDVSAGENLVGSVWQELVADPVTGGRKALYSFVSGSLDK